MTFIFKSAPFGRSMNVNLRPDCQLLDSSFESYKLSLNKIPIFSVKVPELNFERLNEVLSRQHVQAHMCVNCLRVDPFHQGCIYYTNSAGSLVQLLLPELPHDLTEGRVVFTLPNWSELNTKDRQPVLTIQFPAPSTVAVYDGIAKLYLLEIADSEVINVIVLQPLVQSASAYMLDCLLVPADGKLTSRLHCLFSSVSQRSENLDSSKRLCSSYETHLDWLSYEKSDMNSTWSLIRNRRFTATSYPEFVAFEYEGAAVHVCSKNNFVLTSDSAQSALSDSDQHIEVDLNHKNNITDSLSHITPSNYKFSITWEQIESDNPQIAGQISISLKLNSIKLPIEPNPSTVHVRLSPPAPGDNEGINNQNLLIQLTELSTGPSKSSSTITLFDRTLFGPVESNPSWTYSPYDCCINICLKKKDNLHWTHLLYDFKINQDLIFPYEIQEEVKPISVENSGDFNENIGPESPFNVEQLEDVDFPLIEDENDLILQRIDSSTSKCSHQANLSGHQWLFHTACYYDPHKPYHSTQALCLRHDVDGIIWQPRKYCQLTLNDNNQQIWKHVATLQAFGYVLASKQDRRFVSCPLLNDSDPVRFVAVSDVTKRIYIYRQPLPTQAGVNSDTELRRRVTSNSSDLVKHGLVHVAWQHIVTLPTEDPIIGFVTLEKPYDACIACTHDTIYLLPIK